MKKVLSDWLGCHVYVPGKGNGVVDRILKGRLVVKLDNDEGSVFAFPCDCREADLVPA